MFPRSFTQRLRSIVIISVLIHPFLYFSTQALANDQLELARHHASSIGGKVVKIVGQSMQPRLNANDLVIIVPTHWTKIKSGDIVQFQVSEDVRTDRNYLPTWVHQVVIRKGNWIRTAGLNNPDVDPFWVHRRDVVGKVVAVYLDGSSAHETVSDRALDYFRVSATRDNLAKY